MRHPPAEPGPASRTCRTCGYPIADARRSILGYIRCPECGDRGTPRALSSRVRDRPLGCAAAVVVGVSGVVLLLVLWWLFLLLGRWQGI